MPEVGSFLSNTLVPRVAAHELMVSSNEGPKIGIGNQEEAKVVDGNIDTTVGMSSEATELLKMC